MSFRREFTITKLERSPEGHWRANVTMTGKTITVDRQFGSWQVPPSNGSTGRRDVLPDIAAALQARVRPLEKKEADQNEASNRRDHPRR